MKPFSCLLLLTIFPSSISPALAGSYSQDFSAFSAGTTNLNDGTAISSSTGVASVQGGANRYLRLTASGTGSTSASFKLADLDPGKAIDSFSVSFDLQIGGGGTLADGVSLTFGEIPTGNGGGEAGFASANGLVIAWDTYNNGGDTPSVEVFSNGISIDNNLHNYGATANQWVTVTINWDQNGLGLSYNGNVLASNLPTPG
ncbi:hypothetical protein N9B63_04805, partial [Akkermansiaceae bacterium]|nr:hypothetical protein [Akkermansiaceae bacterium]